MALASSLDRQQGRVMGWFHAAASAGFMIGPLACGLLVEYYTQIPLAMTAMGGLGLASTIPLALAHRQNNLFCRSYSLLVPAAFVCSLALGFIDYTPQTTLQATDTSAKADRPDSFAGIGMGNIIRMKLYGLETKKAQVASQAAFSTISQLETQLGHRNSSGALGRINLNAGITPQHVDQHTFDLIKRALHLGRASKGAFDITIGAISVLPYYYQEKAQRDKALLVDYRKVILDEENRTVFLPEAGMALDLGGLAKGTILDRASSTLRKHNVPAALVEAGGDLFCYGDRQWKVGIQHPRSEGLLGVIKVSNAAVCGSGDYYQYVLEEKNNTEKRKHHIVDPAMLESADKSIAVTVIAPSAELADGLATALFILGPEAGKKLLTLYADCSALWVLPDNSTVKTSNFPPFLP